MLFLRTLFPSSANATPFAALRWPLLTACWFLSLGLHAASPLDVPYIGEPADRSLSPLEETELGNEVMRQLRKGGFILEDPELHDYIQALGNRLLRHTNEQAIRFQFFMVRDPGINAFALPGGFIGINAGLLIASETESELAGVLAHEIAHVTQRHIARSMDKSSGWDIATAALVLAAVIAGVNDPDIAQAALGIGLSAAVQQQINFTRANELEADRLGIKTLSDAQFDPQGMATFFHRLSQKGQLYGEGLPELLQTHPVNSTRIAEAQARAASLPVRATASSRTYFLMKTRARVLSTELASESLKYFRSLNKYAQQPADQYGLALALERNRAFADAQTIFQQLIDAQPDERHFKLAMGRLHAAAGNYQQAVAELRELRKKHPEYRPITLSLAEALLRDAQPAVTRQLLLESGLLLRNDSETYRLLAMAARDMNQPAEAHFQFAGYEHSRGDYVEAIRQLHTGLRLTNLATHDKQRLQGRLDQYFAQAPKSERRRAQKQPQPLR